LCFFPAKFPSVRQLHLPYHSLDSTHVQDTRVAWFFSSSLTTEALSPPRAQFSMFLVLLLIDRMNAGAFPGCGDAAGICKNRSNFSPFLSSVPTPYALNSYRFRLTASLSLYARDMVRRKWGRLPLNGRFSPVFWLSATDRRTRQCNPWWQNQFPTLFVFNGYGSFFFRFFARCSPPPSTH